MPSLVTARDSFGTLHEFRRDSTLSVEMPPGFLCADPPVGNGHGNGGSKGQAQKCEHFFMPGNGGKPDCPPGWLKHGDTGACENPGQGGTPPGQGGAPPGQGGTPPGQAKK